MNSAQILAELDRLGVTAVVDNDYIHLAPRSALPDELLEQARGCKADLIRQINLRAAMPLQLANEVADIQATFSDTGASVVGVSFNQELSKDEQYFWDERVAICTFDGGLTVPEAELVAWTEINQMRDLA